MTESRKLRSLRQMRETLTAGTLSEEQRSKLHIATVAGAMLSLNDDGALAAIDERIFEQEIAEGLRERPVEAQA